jgi:hypothetical protein
VLGECRLGNTEVTGSPSDQYLETPLWEIGARFTEDDFWPE